MYLIEKDGRKRAQEPVRKYPNGPQDERERLWRMNRKQFIREIIRRDPASSMGETKKEPR